MASSAAIDEWPSSPYSSSAPDGEVLRSLHRLAQDLSNTEAPALFLREVLLVLQRFKALVANYCVAGSRHGCCCSRTRWSLAPGRCSTTSPRCLTCFRWPTSGSPTTWWACSLSHRSGVAA